MRSSTAACLVFVTLLSTGARASVSNEARFFDDVARRAYAAGRYRDALDAFLQVNDVAPSPAALYNVAVTADLAKRIDVAFVHYREYLAGGDSDAERRQDAEKRLEKLKQGLALVQVESEPPGATIFVDREELGQHGVTPTLIVTEPGQRTILLKAPGHDSMSLSVMAVKGASAAVSGKLETLFGEFAIRSTPAQAQVVFVQQGQPVAPTPIQGKPRLPVGAYAVRVSAAGYVTREVSVAISESAPVDVTVELEALPAREGTLLVSCNVIAEVYVDGARAAQTPATLRVPIGAHQVEVRGRAGKPFLRSVKVSESAAAYVEATLVGPR